MLRLANLIIIGKLYIFYGALKNTNLTYLLEDTSDSNTKKNSMKSDEYSAQNRTSPQTFLTFSYLELSYILEKTVSPVCYLSVLLIQSYPMKFLSYFLTKTC